MQFIVEFRYWGEKFRHKYKFLVQCAARAVVEKPVKWLEKVDFFNTSNVKIKIFNDKRLNMTMFFKLENNSGNYMLDIKVLSFDTNVLGQPVTITKNTEFMTIRK